MSQITEALNKVQKSRHDHQDQKSFDDFRGNALRANSKMIVMVIIAIGAIAAVFISVVVIALDIGSTKTNQNEISSLEKSVKMQEKGINNLASSLVKTKNASENQIQNLDFRLKSEAEDRKAQINNLALIDGVYYSNLIKSILANTHQINYLDKYTKSLKSELDKISVSDSQTKSAN